MLIYIAAFLTSLCIKLVMLMLILSNPVLRTSAQYGETPRYYGPYSLSLVKVSPHIFCKFNPLYTDTFFGPLKELKQRRRRRQRERQKSNRFRLAKQQQSTRASRFIVHFFAVTARLRRENAESDFTFCGERKHNDFLSPFLHFDTVFQKFQLQKRLPTFDELNEVE